MRGVGYPSEELEMSSLSPSSSNCSLRLLLLVPLLPLIFHTGPLSQKMDKMPVVLFWRWVFDVQQQLVQSSLTKAVRLL